MTKQIIILSPNGVEVASRAGTGSRTASSHDPMWVQGVEEACEELAETLTTDPKLGTYTVTVKEVE